MPRCAGVVTAVSSSAVTSPPLLLQALQDAGLPADGPELKDINKMRCGILIGSAMGGLQTFAQAVEDLNFKVSCSCLQLGNCQAQEALSRLPFCTVPHEKSALSGQPQISRQAVWRTWQSW